MDDTIYRQAAIDAVSRGCQEFRGIFAKCEKNLNELPSAQPERITCQIGHELTEDEIESLKKKLLDDAPIVLLPSSLTETITPLEPERKKGRWVYNDKIGTFKIFTCDQCGCNSEAEFNFCMNCGADMRGKSDGTDEG